MNCIPDLKFYTEAQSKTKMPMFKCSKHPQTEIQIYAKYGQKKNLCLSNDDFCWLTIDVYCVEFSLT